jgi:hypothetical protein
MTPLTKFQLVVKAAAEEHQIPKVIVYAETERFGLPNTSIWSSEAVKRDDFFWMRCWLDEQLYLGSWVTQWGHWWRSRPRRQIN